MRIELLSGETNVLRFPVEQRARPTLELLRDLAPDVREVLAVAEAYGLDMPVNDLRDRVDLSTAEHIANQVPAELPQRAAMLAEMVGPVVEAAVRACREAQDLAVDAAEARQRLLGLQASKFWLEPLQERADGLALRAAVMMVAAYARAEEAEGVARAVGLAQRGEAWAPRDFAADFEALLAIRRAG
jgi:hypothetical protein